MKNSTINVIDSRENATGEKAPHKNSSHRKKNTHTHKNATQRNAKHKHKRRTDGSNLELLFRRTLGGVVGRGGDGWPEAEPTPTLLDWDVHLSWACFCARQSGGRHRGANYSSRRHSSRHQSSRRRARKMESDECRIFTGMSMYKTMIKNKIKKRAKGPTGTYFLGQEMVQHPFHHKQTTVPKQWQKHSTKKETHALTCQAQERPAKGAPKCFVQQYNTGQTTSCASKQ